MSKFPMRVGGKEIKQIGPAKQLIRSVIDRINNIRSEKRRRQFQKRFIVRIEEECILSELIGQQAGRLDPKAIHEKAVQLLQQNNENEIMELVGNLLPPSGLKLLREVRDYSILQLPSADRKLLPAPQEVEKPRNLGKRAMSVLKRIAWRSVCDPDSSVYKLWSKKLPQVYNEGYFSVAIGTTFANWRIGLPLVASGVTAIVMKYSAHEFCDWAKPEGLVIDLKDKADQEHP